MMGISRSYVSRIETKAIEKLAQDLKEWTILIIKYKNINKNNEKDLPIIKK